MGFDGSPPTGILEPEDAQPSPKYVLNPVIHSVVGFANVVHCYDSHPCSAVVVRLRAELAGNWFAGRVVDVHEHLSSVPCPAGLVYVFLDLVMVCSLAVRKPCVVRPRLVQHPKVMTLTQVAQSCLLNFPTWWRCQL